MARVPRVGGSAGCALRRIRLRFARVHTPAGRLRYVQLLRMLLLLQMRRRRPELSAAPAASASSRGLALAPHHPAPPAPSTAAFVTAKRFAPESCCGLTPLGCVSSAPHPNLSLSSSLPSMTLSLIYTLNLNICHSLHLFLLSPN